MPSLMDEAKDPVKIIVIGDTGDGKTGALASLVCLGLKIRMIDADKGIKILRSLLTNPNYPYAKYIAEHKINLAEAVSYIPLDVPMKALPVKKHSDDGRHPTFENLLAPANASAWLKIAELLNRWKDGDIDYGPVTSWEDDTVLVLDSFSTIATIAFYYIQQLNGRLGAREEGYDYQRDVGSAQGQLRRLLEALFSPSIRCNVIINSHIVNIDRTKGANQSPEEMLRAGISRNLIDPKGFPQAIGRALSPQIGKYFNDLYVVQRTGEGNNVRRTISTVPVNNISAKNSVFLKPSYNVSTGLAEIFCAMRGEPVPEDLLKTINGG